MLAMGSRIVPRFVAGSSGGFVDAAYAVLALISMLGAGAGFLFVFADCTMRNYPYLGTSAKIAGIAPGAVLVASLLGLLWFIRH